MFIPLRWRAPIGVAAATLIVALLNRPAPRVDRLREESRADAINAVVAALQARLTARQDLAGDLIAGRVALSEAIARYRPLTAVSWTMPRDTPEAARAADQAMIEGLLLDVAYVLRNDPAKEEVVLAGLRADLARRQAGAEPTADR